MHTTRSTRGFDSVLKTSVGHNARVEEARVSSANGQKLRFQLLDFINFSVHVVKEAAAGVGTHHKTAETAVAAALTGEITDPSLLGEMPEIKMPDAFRIDDSAVLVPASPEEAKELEVLRGPNIKKFPDSAPQTDLLRAELVLKVGDNITTDHIMPAGAKILPYRSNIPHLSQYCFGVCDSTFPERAKAAGQSIVVGGVNYG